MYPLNLTYFSVVRDEDCEVKLKHMSPYEPHAPISPEAVVSVGLQISVVVFCLPIRPAMVIEFAMKPENRVTLQA